MADIGRPGAGSSNSGSVSGGATVVNISSPITSPGRPGVRAPIVSTVGDAGVSVSLSGLWDTLKADASALPSWVWWGAAIGLGLHYLLGGRHGHRRR